MLDIDAIAKQQRELLRDIERRVAGLEGQQGGRVQKTAPVGPTADDLAAAYVAVQKIATDMSLPEYRRAQASALLLRLKWSAQQA